MLRSPSPPPKGRGSKPVSIEEANKARRTNATARKQLKEDLDALRNTGSHTRTFEENKLVLTFMLSYRASLFDNGVHGVMAVILVENNPSSPSDNPNDGDWNSSPDSRRERWRLMLLVLPADLPRALALTLAGGGMS